MPFKCIKYSDHPGFHPSKSPTLTSPRGSVCVCCGTSSLLQQFVSTITFLLLQSLKVSQKREWGPPKVFPGYAHWSSKAPGICQSFSKLLRISHSQYNFIKFLAHLLFAPTGITAAGSGHIKQLLLIVFNRHPRMGLLPLGDLWVRSNKASEWGFIRGLPWRSNSGQFSRSRALGELLTYSSPSKDYYTVCFKATGCWGGVGIEQVNIHKAHCSLRSQSFPLNKHSWDYWLISRFLKKLFWSFLPVFSLSLWRSRLLEVLILPFQKCFPI